VALLLIGDPNAAPGAIVIRVVYFDGDAAIAPQSYVAMLRLFATHLLAHADQYDAALAAHS
jgi:hypothetical protein